MKSYSTFVRVYFVMLPREYFELHDWLICVKHVLKDTSHKRSCHSVPNENVAIVNGENLSVPSALVM
jgi:hypothetical protein